MDLLQPAVIVRELERLATDLRELTNRWTAEITHVLPSSLLSVERVRLIGCGDSYFASCAVRPAFERFGGRRCEAWSAQRFLDDVAGASGPGTGTELVIAASASGRTPRVLEAIERAKARGAVTIGVAGDPGSPVLDVADRSVALALPDKERSPGIRSYQATMIGLLLIALRFADGHRRGSAPAADALRAELAGVADAIEDAVRSFAEPCSAVIDSIADAAAVLVLGSDPNYATARFAAAKIVEASGCLAIGQELDEWWHVERFADRHRVPLFIIAPERAAQRAASASAAAAALGRTVVTVGDPADETLRAHASAVLPIRAAVRDEFSPLVYHVFAGYVAAFLAERWGRSLFEGGSASPPLQTGQRGRQVVPGSGRRDPDDRVGKVERQDARKH